MAAAVCARAGGYLDSPGEESRDDPAPFYFLTGGFNLNACPQAGAYYEFKRSWQIGLEARSWIANADTAFDFIPEFDAHLRKLWLSAEDRESMRNSEYADLSAGLFPCYRFLPLDEILPGVNEPMEGLRPHVRLSLGKYWMPFFPAPYGVDINLTLGHYFGGHPPDYAHIDYVTAGISVFLLP